MSCKTFQRNIHKLLDGCLEDKERDILFQHMEVCPSCKSEHKLMTRIRTLLEKQALRAEDMELSADFDQRFWKRLENETTPRTFWHWQPFLKPSPVVAAVVTISIVVFLFTQRIYFPGRKNEIQPCPSLDTISLVETSLSLARLEEDRRYVEDRAKALLNDML